MLSNVTCLVPVNCMGTLPGGERQQSGALIMILWLGFPNFKDRIIPSGLVTGQEKTATGLACSCAS